MNASTSLPAILPAPDCDMAWWFDREVRPHEPALRAYLRGRFPELADPDDIVQETYIRLIRARQSGSIQTPKALLFVIARNLAVDAFRRQRSNANTSLGHLGEISAVDELPGEVVSFRERKLQLLEEALQALPARCREVILLKKIHGLSYDEIAQRLGISHNTISAHLTAGVAKCRDYFQERGLMKGADS